MELDPARRRQLKALAHSLDPVVMIGDKGLSPAVLKEIDVNLRSHELIKVRVAGDERRLREDYLRQICESLGASAVQHIGKILVVYRENPDAPARVAERPSGAARRASTPDKAPHPAAARVATTGGKRRAKPARPANLAPEGDRPQRPGASARRAARPTARPARAPAGSSTRPARGPTGAAARPARTPSGSSARPARTPSASARPARSPTGAAARPARRPTGKPGPGGRSR